MKVKYECNKGIMKFHLTPESDNISSFQIKENSFKTTYTASLGMKSCEFHLPENWTLNSVHPDLLALAAIGIIYPFIGTKIVLPIGVSNEFHHTFENVTGKKVLPINRQLPPRKAKPDYCPALVYSGGVDSTVASLLLPKNTHLLYLNRITPNKYKHVRSLLNQEAAYFACDWMKKHGRFVHSIKTDVPYIKKPAGFLTFLTDGASSLLLADYYGFDCLSNGHTLEEGYQIGYNGYIDAKESELIKIWDPLLKVVDLPYCLPTIGLSEVCTSKMILNSPYYEVAHACSRGKVHKPCMKCTKCFRKTLLEKVVKNEPIDNKLLDQFFKLKDVQRLITKSPIHFENIFTYITSKYNGNHPIMNALKKKTRGDILETSWMEKWNPSSLQYIAPKYQKYITSEISKYVKTMNEKDQKNMKNFNYNHITDPTYVSYEQKLKALISKL